MFPVLSFYVKICGFHETLVVYDAIYSGPFEVDRPSRVPTRGSCKKYYRTFSLGRYGIMGYMLMRIIPSESTCPELYFRIKILYVRCVCIARAQI